MILIYLHRKGSTADTKMIHQKGLEDTIILSLLNAEMGKVVQRIDKNYVKRILGGGSKINIFNRKK